MQQVGSYFCYENAYVYGDVHIGKNTSIWPFTAIRGDVASIYIGEQCSIQDGTVVHCKSGVDQHIGNRVIVGHQACLHCKEIGDDVLIGTGSKILDDAIVQSGSLVASGAVVTPGTVVESGWVYAGVPAKKLRPIKDEELAYIAKLSVRYLDLAKHHLAGKQNVLGR